MNLFLKATRAQTVRIRHHFANNKARAHDLKTIAASSNALSSKIKVHKAAPSEEQINALFRAAYEDDDVGMRALVLSGIDPNIAHPGSGHTPMRAACESNSVRVVQALLDLGVDPNATHTYHSSVDHRVEKNVFALIFAASVDIAKALVDAGADVNACDASGNTALMRKAVDADRKLTHL